MRDDFTGCLIPAFLGQELVLRRNAGFALGLSRGVFYLFALGLVALYMIMITPSSHDVKYDRSAVFVFGAEYRLRGPNLVLRGKSHLQGQSRHVLSSGPNFVVGFSGHFVPDFIFGRGRADFPLSISSSRIVLASGLCKQFCHRLQNFVLVGGRT